MAADVTEQNSWPVIALADGTRWAIRAADEESAAVVRHLSRVMGLRPETGPACELAVVVDRQRASDSLLELTGLATGCHDLCTAVCRLSGGDQEPSLTYLYGLGAALSLCVQGPRAVLLHGALAELDGTGVLLAGQSGAGKTTASERLPHPWRSLCDDSTLVVRDRAGTYWAHPWPTWSRFFLGEASGAAWNVQRAVMLRGIFFLEQSEVDWCEPVKAGEAVGYLLGLAEQVSRIVLGELDREEARNARVRRLDTVCKLAQAVPAHRLHASRAGAFWQEIERTLLDGTAGAS